MVTEKLLIEYLKKRSGWDVKRIQGSVGPSWCLLCGELVQLWAVDSEGFMFGFCSDLAECEKREKKRDGERAKSVESLLSDITLPEVKG